MHEAIGERQHQGRVRLGDLMTRPHFYGVGALEKLTGEVTVLDGAATVTKVSVDGAPSPLDADVADANATLVVGAYVPRWTEHAISSAVPPGDLDRTVAEMAAKSGLDVSKPFVFVIDGVFNDVRLHVINGACPMHARLKKLELPKDTQPFEANLSEVQGTVVGVYAKDAVGQMTHPGTSTHMHVQFTQRPSGATMTGHVEQLGLSAGGVLYLPWVK